MLTVWREPQGHVPYCIGVDTAEGLGFSSWRLFLRSSFGGAYW